MLAVSKIGPFYTKERVSQAYYEALGMLIETCEALGTLVRDVELVIEALARS